MLFLVSLAGAADLDVYRAALRVVDERYLWPERIDHAAMFRAAADRLEERVEWLQSVEEGETVRLRGGRWSASIRLAGDLPAALARVEDAVRAAGLPLGEGLDLRAELLSGALSTLDRHSVALAGDSLERFDERLSGTLTGIGVTMRTTDGHLTVTEVFDGGPAARAGLLPRDVIARIDGVSTTGMSPTEATERIRGRAGTLVHLTLARGETQQEVAIERADVTIPNVSHRAGRDGVGIVQIDHFSEQTTANLQKAITALRDAGELRTGLVVDLRGNTGGSLIQSARAADMLTDSGRIVLTAGRDGEKVAGLVREVEARAEPQAWDGPVVVLVDHDTASGAEILAGALLHLDRAILIGEGTFGKGTVQTLTPLAEDLKLKLTVAEYILDDDAHVAGVGLAPDLAMYPVDLDKRGVHWDEPSRVRLRVGTGTPLVYWARPDREDEAEAEDAPLRAAEALLRATDGSTRASMLRTLQALLPTLANTQAVVLGEALRAHDVDWSEPVTDAAQPQVSVRLAPVSTPRAGESVELVATVRNLGPELAQAAVRLRSVNPLWDDAVLPLGRIPAEATVEGRVAFSVAADAPARTDRVVGVLECVGATPITVIDDTLAVEGRAEPLLAVTARLDAATLHLDVASRDDRMLTGVRPSIAFPDLEGVELIDPSPSARALAPGGHATWDIPLRIAQDYPGPEVPLHVDVKVDGFGTLARWDLPMRLDGSELSRAAPELSLRSGRTHQPPGRALITVTASDPDGLDHVVVSGGPVRVDRSRWEATVDWDADKLLYNGALGRKVSFPVDVPVEPGTNRYVVRVEDSTGLRTERTLYIHGDGQPPDDDGVAMP